MQTLTINIKNKKVADEVTQMLKKYNDEEVELISIEDLKLIKATRNEESISFEKYLENEN